MLIVIEGPSKAGKTTLARNLAEELKKEGIDARVWDRPEEIEEVKEKYSIYDAFVLDEIHFLQVFYDETDKRVIIVDRHPVISEFVYSKLKNRRSMIVERFGSISEYVNESKIPLAIIYLRRGSEREVELYDQAMMELNGIGIPILWIGEYFRENELKYAKNFVYAVRGLP
jgi:thymidylate kinase